MILLCTLLCTAPRFTVQAPLPARIASEAQALYDKDLARIADATGQALTPSDRSIVIGVAADLRGSDAGTSQLGVLRLRKDAGALAHELAHQVLLIHCPQASADKLFHEAFAISVSGELDAWIDEGYFSSVRAQEVLASAVSRDALDTREARQALARLIADGKAGNKLPVAVARRLVSCVSGAAHAPLQTGELAAAAAQLHGDAFVIVSRHSGETLRSEGEIQLPMPFASTLKPFVVAGASARPPVLAADLNDPLWRCGDKALAALGVKDALSRSCNGYFLSWAKRDPALAQFGAFGALLTALGLERLPAHMDEAIGLRPTLALTPLQLAQAYRVLADARPDVLAMLQETARDGTLAGLQSSGILSMVALKTGTVRDPANKVRLGWIVAVANDWVAVMTRTGAMPRSFADDLATRVGSIASVPHWRSASVQVFALLDRADVQVECRGVPVRISAGKPQLGAHGFFPLRDAGMCLGLPFTVRFPGLAAPRLYAGAFSLQPNPVSSAGEGRADRARRGSDVVFTTTLQRYTTGVLASEDATISAEPKRALARVIAHNAAHGSERHPGQLLCDTSHCQVFQGTPARAEIAASTFTLAPWLDSRGFLPFSRGGDEPWAEERSFASVVMALGDDPLSLHFSGSQVRFEVQADGVESSKTTGCERLRAPLRLPSCPQAATRKGNVVRFTGHGAGHGLGLDVEAAKKDRTRDAEAILKHAYQAH